MKRLATENDRDASPGIIHHDSETVSVDHSLGACDMLGANEVTPCLLGRASPADDLQVEGETVFDCTFTDAVPTSFCAMMGFLVEDIWKDSSVFGQYCRTWVQACSMEQPNNRCRDIYPLPMLGIFPLSSDLGVDPKLLLDVSNLCIMGLNFLWDDCAAAPSSPTIAAVSASQRCVHENVTSGVHRMFLRLSEKEARRREMDAPAANPDLVADLIEMAESSGTCDAQSYLPQNLHDAICGDGGLFRNVTTHRKIVPRYSGKDRSQYARATVRALVSGKLRLRTKVEAGGTVFCVAKPSGGQREVWHGRYVSGLVPSPPKPRHQPTPSCLLDLEAGPAQPLFFSKRDATAYFDSLVAPTCVQPWFGRPALRLSELLAVLDPSSTINLRDFIDNVDGEHLDESSRLHPYSCVWPMGFSYSSAVGQEVMLA